jgi:cell division septation protein DedD
MTRTENEQEFVLGNKQLLSAFFVVVALLAVFFTMGYIIGRNSEASVPGKTRGASADPVTTSTPPVTSSQPDTPAPAPPPAEAAKPETAATEPPPQVETPRKEAAKKEAKPAETPADESPVAAVSSSSGHTYLQVMAVKRPVADSTVKMLKERGFPALLGESSRPELFRVMVGPYADTETLAKAKSDLKKMGFDSVVAK